MENFNYNLPTELFFGKGQQEELKNVLPKYAKKVLLHFGGSSIKKQGIYDFVVNELNKMGMPYVELGGVVPNPRLSLVKEGIELCRKENVDFILAVGGGSVIDSAKAISVGAVIDFDVWDCFIGKAQLPADINPLGVGVILTIPAAGSECSDSMVITNEETELKQGFSHSCIRPKFSILNPEYTYSLPANQTANGVSDIVAHMFERYFTNTRHVDVTDRLLEACITTTMRFAKAAIENPENYDYRAEIMWCGTIAHNNMLGVGRSQDWASHGIEHEVSAIYDIAHGAGLSIIFPAWMKYVYKHDIDRFVQFATRVMGVECSVDNKEICVLQAIERLEDFYKSIDLPIRLSDLNIDDSRIEEMAKKCTASGPKGSFVKLECKDVLEIYKLAL